MRQRVHMHVVPGLPGVHVCGMVEGCSRPALAMDTDTKLREQDRGEGGRRGPKRQAAAVSHVQKICPAPCCATNASKHEATACQPASTHR